MRRGPVQDRTLPLQREQTLSTARRHSLSESLYYSFFMISCRGEQTKEFQRKEKDLQRLPPPLLVPIAVCYESGKPGILNII